MGIVATETGDAACIHQALNEIIALHAVLVGGAIGEMSKCERTEHVRLELPKVREV